MLFSYTVPYYIEFSFLDFTILIEELEQVLTFFNNFWMEGISKN